MKDLLLILFLAAVAVAPGCETKKNVYITTVEFTNGDKACMSFIHCGADAPYLVNGCIKYVRKTGPFGTREWEQLACSVRRFDVDNVSLVQSK